MAVVGTLIVVLPSAAAVAHGGDDSDQAQVLVVEALAYLANQPDGYMDNVADKINDALAASDTTGVDLSKVVAAKQAMDANDMMQVRTLLQQSVQPMAGPVTGDDTGTTVMLDPVRGSTGWGRHGRDRARGPVGSRHCGRAVVGPPLAANRFAAGSTAAAYERGVVMTTTANKDNLTTVDAAPRRG